MKELIDKLQDIDVATALDGDRECLDTYTAIEIIAICKAHYNVERLMVLAIKHCPSGHPDWPKIKELTKALGDDNG